MNQLSLFDTLRSSPIIQSLAPDGDIIRGEADCSFVLPHPRLAYPLAQIDLHAHHDGSWMWGVNFSTSNRGGGYRVGPKWGKFATSHDDALFYAVRELLSNLVGVTGSDAMKVRAWLSSIAPEAT